MIKGVQFDTSDLQDGVKDLIKKIKKINPRVAILGSILLIGKSKILAPHKTGELRRSIVIKSTEVSAGIVTVEYGSELPYALIQERGGRAGRNKSVYITGNHYLLTPTLNLNPVLSLYKKTFDKLL